MKKFKVWLVMFIICLCPVMVSAHPGKLDKSGCHTCRKNCSRWGLSTGQYHCHGGSSTNNKTTSSNNSKKAVKKNTTKKTTSKSNINKSSNKSSNKNIVVAKSTNANLKSLIINSDVIEIKEHMEYRTSADVVQLEAKAVDSKAITQYDSKVVLNDGSNKVNIKVVAEDNSVVKDYVVDIIKLSSNTNINVYIDGKRIELEDDNVFNTYNESVGIECKTVSEKATVEVNGYNDKLAIGDNVIRFIVTAEDGTKKEYLVVIKRNDMNAIIDFDIDTLLKKNDSTNPIYRLWFKIIYFIFHGI